MASSPDPSSPSTVDQASAGSSETNPRNMLFGFSGRISRETFWFGTLILCFFFWPLMFVASKAGGPGEPLWMGTPGNEIAYTLGNFPSTLEMSLSGLLFLVHLWILFALQAKRWHDRGRSGWWCLINLLPIFGAFWTFMECGCMRGTAGPNRYGKAPTN